LKNIKKGFAVDLLSQILFRWVCQVKNFELVASFQLNSTFKMGFCEHRAAIIMAEFNDARAEKLKKIKLPEHRFSSIFYNT